MPLVGIPISRLNSLIGKDIPRDELDTLLRRIGCDVEGYKLLKRFRCECGEIYETEENEKEPVCEHGTLVGHKITEINPIEVIRIELLPDRPDNFDPGGLARTLRGYLGLESGLPSYTVKEPLFSLFVDQNLSNSDSYRPFINCAVIRGVNLDEEFLRILMKLQENLHWGLGRNRKNASIGVYDLDKIKPDISYRAVSPRELKFIPLGESKSFFLDEILKEHPKGVGFSHLLSHFSRYPILSDKNGNVLSMPPIINSESTRVACDTKNLFIDVTGVNENASKMALNIIVTSIIELDRDATLHAVKINYPDKTRITPDLSAIEITCDADRITKLLGIPITNEEIVSNLRKMRFECKLFSSTLNIKIPPYRNDIMHEYDIAEDVAVAYGYHNIKPALVKGMTIGKRERGREQANKIREIMTGLGFVEVITLMLTSADELARINYAAKDEECVQIENPLNAEQTILRPTLLPGILNILKTNTHNELPQLIFEVGDVVLLDDGEETKSKESLKLAVAILDSKVGFSDIQSILFSVASEMKWKIELAPIDDPMLIPGRAASITVNGKVCGLIGEVHPEILTNLGLCNPCAIFELVLI